MATLIAGGRREARDRLVRRAGVRAVMFPALSLPFLSGLAEAPTSLWLAACRCGGITLLFIELEELEGGSEWGDALAARGDRAEDDLECSE